MATNHEDLSAGFGTTGREELPVLRAGGPRKIRRPQHRPGRYVPSYSYAATLAWCLLASGCFYAKPVVVPESDTRLAALRTDSVLVIEPQTSFEEEDPNADSAEEWGAAEMIFKAVSSGLTQRGFAVRSESMLGEEQRRKLRETLSSLARSGTLFQPRKRKQVLAEQLAFLAPAEVLVVSAIRTGQRVSVAPASALGNAEPTVPRRTSNVVLVVVDLRKAQTVWAKEVFFRSRPPGARTWMMSGAIWPDAAYSDGLRDSLQILLSDFPNKER